MAFRLLRPSPRHVEVRNPGNRGRVVRETPLSSIHLENMPSLAQAGAIVFPPVPAFYTRPQTIQQLVDQRVGRMLDSFGIHCEDFPRWQGFEWSKVKR